MKLKVLHQNYHMSNPMGEEFIYSQEFKRLHLEALKKDLHVLMTDSQDWWPAEYGHYGPLFIRDGLNDQQMGARRAVIWQNFNPKGGVHYGGS